MVANSDLKLTFAHLFHHCGPTCLAGSDETNKYFLFFTSLKISNQDSVSLSNIIARNVKYNIFMKLYVQFSDW